MDREEVRNTLLTFLSYPLFISSLWGEGGSDKFSLIRNRCLISGWEREEDVGSAQEDQFTHSHLDEAVRGHPYVDLQCRSSLEHQGSVSHSSFTLVSMLGRPPGWPGRRPTWPRTCWTRRRCTRAPSPPRWAAAGPWGGEVGQLPASQDQPVLPCALPPLSVFAEVQFSDNNILTNLDHLDQFLPPQGAVFQQQGPKIKLTPFLFSVSKAAITYYRSFIIVLNSRIYKVNPLP